MPTPPPPPHAHAITLVCSSCPRSFPYPSLTPASPHCSLPLPRSLPHPHPHLHLPCSEHSRSLWLCPSPYTPNPNPSPDLNTHRFTQIPVTVREELLLDLGVKYRAEDYNIMTNNCKS